MPTKKNIYAGIYRESTTTTLKNQEVSCYIPGGVQVGYFIDFIIEGLRSEIESKFRNTGAIKSDTTKLDPEVLKSMLKSDLSNLDSEISLEPAPKFIPIEAKPDRNFLFSQAIAILSDTHDSQDKMKEAYLMGIMITNPTAIRHLKTAVEDCFPGLDFGKLEDGAIVDIIRFFLNAMGDKIAESQTLDSDS